MSVKRLSALVSALVLSLALAPAVAQPALSSAYAEPPRPRGPMAPGEWKALQDTSGGIGLPERALLKAAEQSRQTPSAPVRWQPEGPTNIGGRVTGVALDPRQPDTVYVGAASGGMWKSTDKATTLRAIWPESYPQAIGAVATASDGALYVGTGESNPGGGSLTYEGDGVYKSVDGGKTWRRLGLRASATIAYIAIDPANPKRLFVAATGSLFRSGGERGLYRSLDGGATWQRVLAPENATTGANDVKIDPRNPNRIWAAMWDRQRTPSLRRYGGPGSGLFRSTDGGTSWKRLTNVVTPSPGDDTKLQHARLGRIGIGVAADRMYVQTSSYGEVGGQPQNHKGFYISTDGGDSFNTRAVPTGSVPYWWTGFIWVDPANAEHIYVPSANLAESLDGGRTWRYHSGGDIHVDHHAMVWDPRVPGRVYEGNDGGIYRSDRNGDLKTWIKATHEPYTQFYSVGTSAQDATRLVGGTQDNGSLRTWNGPRWNAFHGGDGEANVIDPANQNVVYSCFQFGACAKSTDAGDTLTYFEGAESDRFNWFSPVELHPADSKVVYFAGDRVNRSTDGLNFTPISPDLTDGPGDDEVYPFGTLTTIAASKSAPDTLLAGSDDGRVSLTRDQGATWSLKLKDQPWVTRVEVDPRNARRALATLSGYRATGNGGHVLASRDGGETWRDVSGNLPGAPVNDIVIGPYGLLLVGTDVGVFAGLPSGRRWLRLGDLPLASVTDIEYNAASGRLYAATFGRGIYSTPITRTLSTRLR